MGRLEERTTSIQKRKMNSKSIDRSSLPSGTRFLYRTKSLLKGIAEDLVLEWSPSGEFVKLEKSGWLSSQDISQITLLEIISHGK